MTRSEFAGIDPGTEVIWNATDERGYHHDLKAVFVRRGAVQIRIKTRDGIETWTNARNLRLAKGKPSPMRQVLRFEPNQPVTVALEYPDGINVQSQYNGPQVKFSLTENRMMYLDPEPARALGLLKLQPGEPFVITKRVERGKSPWWDFSRVKAASEAIRAALPPDSPIQQPKTQPTPVSAPTPVVSAGDVKRIPPQSVPAQPPHAGGIHLTRTPPVKPSYEEAFRECLRIVTAKIGSGHFSLSRSGRWRNAETSGPV